MTALRSLDALPAEALAHPVQGWDFRWLRESRRFEEGTVPWDYDQLVRQQVRGSPDLLDLGTGGGEHRARFRVHPRRTVATESYAPNVRVAARRLAPSESMSFTFRELRTTPFSDPEERFRRCRFVTGCFTW